MRVEKITEDKCLQAVNITRGNAINGGSAYKVAGESYLHGWQTLK